MLKNHQIKRTYIAICEGILPNKVTKINLPIQRDAKNRKLMSIHKDGKRLCNICSFVKNFLYR
nr:hypothetical protein [Mycoplasmopsis bovis]